jgi:hypothetical protein
MNVVMLTWGHPSPHMRGVALGYLNLVIKAAAFKEERSLAEANWRSAPWSRPMTAPMGPGDRVQWWMTCAPSFLRRRSLRARSTG